MNKKDFLKLLENVADDAELFVSIDISRIVDSEGDGIEADYPYALKVLTIEGDKIQTESFEVNYA